MTEPTSNFAFLAARSPKLARLGALAERYFADDAPASLVKLRQLAEFIAKDVAARQAALPAYDVSFDDVLRTLRTRGVLARGYSAHSMRATFITTALENGAQLEDVQKAAGHRDPSTTKLYDRRGYNPEKAASFFATN